MAGESVAGALLTPPLRPALLPSDLWSESRPGFFPSPRQSASKTGGGGTPLTEWQNSVETQVHPSLTTYLSPILATGTGGQQEIAEKPFLSPNQAFSGW
jgi:hypothetical protein